MKNVFQTDKKKRIIVPVCFGIIVFIIAYFTYFKNYWYPPNLFWDENYHIAASEKYLKGIFFMEPHPPLGKLFIALGEYIWHPNDTIDKTVFLTTDYIKNIPSGYSFIGVRFFPALFAMFSSVLFYLILYRLSKKPFLSFLFTSLYLFENAIIVHSRGAMLESIQIFFMLLMILVFLRNLDSVDRYSVLKKSLCFKTYAVLGILFGLVVAVKLNGFILILLYFFLFVYERYKLVSHHKKNKIIDKKSFVRLIINSLWFVWGTAFICVSVYYIHFFIGRTVLENRYYEASDKYKKILDQKKTHYIEYLPIQLNEHVAFISHYEKGVPKYDPCKPGENGSHPVTWPFGNKSINYRWEAADGKVKYLYLQGNPLVWFFGLSGVFLSINLVISYLLFGLKVQDKKRLFLIASFLMLYVLYMVSMISLDRVMYLYHYFIPLILSIIQFFLMIQYLFQSRIEKGNRFLYFFVIVGVTMIVCVYLFFSPLSYYIPLSNDEFQLRNWFWFWKLTSIR